MNTLRWAILVFVLLFQTMILAVFGSVLFDQGAFDTQAADALGVTVSLIAVLTYYLFYDVGADVVEAAVESTRPGYGDIGRASIATLLAAGLVVSWVQSPATISDPSLLEARNWAYFAVVAMILFNGFAEYITRGVERAIRGWLA